jgi:tripartite-type tricarboxylate transporter receptor subunit TctC
MLERVVAKALSAELKQQVIVENRGGAGGTIGAANVARAAADGYTLLLSNVTLTSAPALYKSLPYDFSKDMSAISMLGQVPCVLVINKNLPAKDGKSFLEYLKANDGQLNYGSSGVGAALHLATQSFLNAANINAIHVPYKGTGPMMIDLISGNVQFAIDTAGSASSQIRGGNVLGVAVTSEERVPTWPDLPTLKELGVPFEMSIWYGISAPAGVSPAVQKKLHAALEKATRTEDVVNAYASMGMQLDTRGGQAFQDVVEADTERWIKLVRDAGIQPN